MLNSNSILTKPFQYLSKSFVYFQPEPPKPENMEHFLHAVNAFALPPEELKCAEYCFQCRLNPMQDPSFGGNVHHRDVLLTALSNSCGGLVFQTAQETPHKTMEFSTFTNSSISTSLDVERSQLAVHDKVWSVIAAKRSKQIALYKLEGDEVELQIDINGKVQYIPRSGYPPSIETPGVDEKGNPDAVSTDAFEPPSSEPRANDTTSSQVPSIVSELNWDQNKKNWRGILQKTKTLTDECLNSCDFLEPHMPMQLTPDKDLLRSLFPSDATFDEVLQKIDPKVPGFAIASGSWQPLLPQYAVLEHPPNYLCDVLTVSKHDDSTPKICLWVVVSGSNEQIIREQVQYMFTFGRSIKHQIANQGMEVPHLAIQCMVHSTQEEDNFMIQNTLRVLGIVKTQDFVCSLFTEQNTFDAVRRCIGRLLLSQDSHIMNCAGEQLSVKLSAKQAKTLLGIRRRRVSYVSSAPGTGKTLCEGGMVLHRDIFGKERSVYVCPTEALVQYLRYNGCEATLVRDDEELNGEITKGTFDNKRCVIIDESHHLRCSKECLKELFWMLHKHSMFLFVFADNEFQSFDRENQKNIKQYIFELSNEILGDYPNTPTFKEMYRNPRKVVSFLQHAIEEPDQDITWGNPCDGEGIQVISLEKLWDNSHVNGLVQYLQQLLVRSGSSADGRYYATQVAVLLDSGHSSSDVDTIGHILKRQLSHITVQTSDKFPRKGITVDKIDSFVGLDAPLCIFLLSAERSTSLNEVITNTRYRVFLASRATHKAVFVVSKIDPELIQCLKFDYFQVRTHLPLLG